MSRTRTGSDPARRADAAWLLIPGSAVLLALLLNLFVVVFAYVPSGSMESTIKAGSLVIGSRLSYGKAAPGQGDVIFFRHGETGSDVLIKRVIAVAGDTLEIRDGVVLRNGVALNEPYAMQTSGSFGPVTVPEGKLFVMGDHRSQSIDSRFWEDPFVDITDVVGKAIFLLPSFEKL